MAGTFDKLKSSVNKGITTISVKTSSSIEKTKIKTHIDTLNDEIENLLNASGKIAYNVWTSGGDDYSTMYENFEIIKGKKAEIDKLVEEMAQIDIRDGQILGKEVEATVEAPKADMVTCPSCGTSYASAVKFCTKCGAKMS